MRELLLRERRIFAYEYPIDIRKSYNGLSALVEQGMKKDPLSGDIYVFINKRGHLIKCLIWDRNGYSIVSKRLEQGRFVTCQKELTMATFSLLFDGIKLGASQRK